MSILMAILVYGVPFLVVVCVITFVHEFGHFLVARRCGVRIEAFAVGFGPELFGYTDRYGTRFKFCLLPLGGYVKMFGEQGFIKDDSGRLRRLTREEARQAYFERPVAQRAAIVAAGPLVNLVFGVVIVALAALVYGVVAKSPTIGAIRADSPAAVAGLRIGDKIVAVADQHVTEYADIVAALTAAIDRDVTLRIVRGDASLEITVRPEAGLARGATVGDIGISSAGAMRRHLNPLQAIGYGATLTADFIRANITGLGEIIAGSRSVNELAGPLRIAEMSGKTMLEHGIMAVVLLTAFLSINIGIVNLLPIPVLDGGHLVFLAVEAIRRRPLNPRIMSMCSLGGLVALLTLFVIITGNDILYVGDLK